MMRASSKQFGDSCVSTPILHLIVDDHQVAFADVEKGVVFYLRRNTLDKFYVWYRCHQFHVSGLPLRQAPNYPLRG